MAASFKGAISFGLVNIPVELVTATQESDISFNLLHKCGGRIRYKKTCPDCGIEDVKQSDIVKGYEYDDDKYITITQAEFDSIKMEKDKNINILHFSDIGNVDPLYYEKSYYVVSKNSEKPYSLLRQAMLDTGMIAVARLVIGTKEHMAIIRPLKDGMVLETLYYNDEIRALPTPEPSDPKKAELDMAKQLISSMTGTFSPDEYANAYRERVMALIDAKVSGKKISAPKSKKTAEVIDLMEALKRSVAETNSKPKTQAKQKPAKAIKIAEKTPVQKKKTAASAAGKKKTAEATQDKPRKRA